MTTHHDDDAMAAVTAELARIVLADEPLETILDRSTHLAKRMLPGAAEVSIALMDSRGAASMASTGELATQLDERQEQVGHGPCLDAARTGIESHVHDMRTETRWPDYTPRAVEAGALSSLSIPLPVQQTPIGALNIYSTERSAKLMPTWPAPSPAMPLSHCTTRRFSPPAESSPTT